MAYKNFDRDVDYSIRLDQMMAAGASAQEVQDVLDQRIRKATSDESLYQYAYDSAYAKARSYIDRHSGVSGQAGAGVSGAGSYRDPYAEQLSAVFAAYRGREPFAYDPEDDPLYQSYRSAYRREGDRARREAVGSAAALTGGQASTAAVAAASQAQDYYNSKLGDALPGLYELAYKMYQDEGESMLGEIESLAKLSASSASAYQAGQKLAYEQAKDARDAQRAMYESARERADGDLKRGQGVEDEAFDRAMAFLNAGVMPTAQMLKAAGLDRQAAENYRAAALRKLNGK